MTNNEQEAQELLKVYREYDLKLRGPDYQDVPENVMESLEASINQLGYEVVEQPHRVAEIRPKSK